MQGRSAARTCPVVVVDKMMLGAWPKRYSSISAHVDLGPSTSAHVDIGPCRFRPMSDTNVYQDS